MEPNTYQEKNNVHQLYPETDTVRDRDSWGIMFEKLSTDMSSLWERQSRLIATELSEKAGTIKVATGSLVTGGIFLFVGLMCLAATAIIGLSYIVDPWIAAAIVTVVLSAIGLVMLKGAQKKLVGRNLLPRKSIEAMGRIKTTFQERIHELKRQ